MQLDEPPQSLCNDGLIKTGLPLKWFNSWRATCFTFYHDVVFICCFDDRDAWRGASKWLCESSHEFSPAFSHLSSDRRPTLRITATDMSKNHTGHMRTLRASWQKWPLITSEPCHISNEEERMQQGGNVSWADEFISTALPCRSMPSKSSNSFSSSPPSHCEYRWTSWRYGLHVR